jgi:hypothetical protein
VSWAHGPLPEVSLWLLRAGDGEHSFTWNPVGRTRAGHITQQVVLIQLAYWARPRSLSIEGWDEQGGLWLS